MAISWKPSAEMFKKIPKVAGIGGLIAGGAVALPIAVMSLRNSRRPSADDMPPLPQELTAPIPAIMEYPPQMTQPQAQAQTMMGEAPVEGDFTKRYKAQQSGAQALDTTIPNLTRADGLNAIDGSRKVEELATPAGRRL